MNARGANARGTAQYLAHFACPEHHLSEHISGRYGAVLIVPAFREPPGFIGGFRGALARAPGRVLVIIVVNAAEAHARESWPEHRALLAELCAGPALVISESPPAWLVTHPDFDVLAIDRASPSWCLPAAQGVGLARRIGCDIALGLHARGSLADPFLYCTDADAELPEDYFCSVAPEAQAASARVFSFWHVPGGDAAIDSATALYELGLRYHVAGLTRAGSPYAYHALGSTLAVRADAYAAVRGFPRRLAGEDFYLLDKLAKVGLIWRHDSRSVRLRSRPSERTPHGTGAAALKLVRDPESHAAPFYHPRGYELLGAWLDALDEFANTRDVARAQRWLSRAGEGSAELCSALDEMDVWLALDSAARRCRDAEALRRRLHTWFDGFRTLKLLHALRDSGLAARPFRSALAAAPWCCSAERAQAADVDELRGELFRAHLTTAPLVGVAAPRSAWRQATPFQDDTASQ